MAPSHAHLLARRAVLSVLAPAVQQLRARDAGRRQDVLPGVEVRRPALPLAVVPAPERHHAPADVYGPCQRDHNQNGSAVIAHACAFKAFVKMRRLMDLKAML